MLHDVWDSLPEPVRVALGIVTVFAGIGCGFGLCVRLFFVVSGVKS